MPNPLNCAFRTHWLSNTPWISVNAHPSLQCQCGSLLTCMPHEAQFDMFSIFTLPPWKQLTQLKGFHAIFEWAYTLEAYNMPLVKVGTKQTHSLPITIITQTYTGLLFSINAFLISRHSNQIPFFPLIKKGSPHSTCSTRKRN